MRKLYVFVLWASLVAPVWAQFKEPESIAAPQLGGETTQRLRVGFSVQSSGLTFRIVATATVPGEWPEQQVRVIREDLSPSVKNLTYRQVVGGGGLRQMVVEIPQLPAGQEAHAYVTFEVTRKAVLPPTDTAIYSVPAKLPRELLLNVGPSPYIESRHPKIVAAAKEAVGAAETDWSKVQAIYEWTRSKIAYKTGEMKGAARTLLEGQGDADDVTSVFVALCRAQKIPARTVFLDRHCTAEFYLVDGEGKGRWFPCQLAGTPAFGAIDDPRPILQKGDNFKNPENTKEKLRWVTEYFHASTKGGKPKVKFVCETVAE